MNTGDFDAAARGWANLGGDYVDIGRYSDAEKALLESLRLVKTHHLRAAANALSNLARLRGKQGDRATAERLFQAALDAHESVTPLWVVYYERGSFRLETGDARAALSDFRESRRLAIRLRADMVPADRDRVSLENYLSRVFEGLVDAGNQVAVSGHNPGADQSIPGRDFRCRGAGPHVEPALAPARGRRLAIAFARRLLGTSGALPGRRGIAAGAILSRR